MDHTNDKSIETREETYSAELIEDANGIYTFYLSSHRGCPIISGEDKDAAAKNFWEAQEMIICIENLMNFKQKYDQEHDKV